MLAKKAINKTSHKEILSYWDDKYITCDNKILKIEDLIGYDECEVKKVTNLIDQPTCWCCGLFVDNIVQLERAHIIPKALGGTHDASNLFLMCKYCHEDSPDFINMDYFISYIYDKKDKCCLGFEYDYSINRIKELAKKMNKNIETFDKDRFFEIMQTMSNNHFGKISRETLFSAAVESMR